MIIEKITCENFRNFEKINFKPDQGINIIYGENAQGKTNLIEAIWLFCGAKSFRGAKDAELLKFEKTAAVNQCDFTFGGVKKSSKIIITNKRKAELNGKALASATELAGKFYCIVFSPMDLNLISGAPAMRRRFLDTSIGQLYPVYNQKLRAYIKAVEQRNGLLRDIKFHPELTDLLDDFEFSMADYLIEVEKHRYKYIKMLQTVAPELYKGISGGREQLELGLVSAFPENADKKQVLQILKNARKEDLFTGNTSVGPHRDDIDFILNGQSAKKFASQGQKRSIALSMKLSEVRVIEKLTGEYPVCLLDDVMSELDKTRQDFVLNHVRNWQVFLTCCDPSNISGLKGGAVFEMKNGKISRLNK